MKLGDDEKRRVKRIREALDECEQALENLLGKGHRDAWRLLNVHIDNGRVAAIGSHQAAADVLGSPLVAADGNASSFGTLPTLIALRRSAAVTPREKVGASAGRARPRSARTIEAKLAKPKLRQQLMREITEHEVMHDRAIAWQFAEAAAVMGAAVKTPDLTEDAWRYFGRALEAAARVHKLEHPTRKERTERTARSKVSRKGGVATKGTRRKHVHLVLLTIDHLAEQDEEATPEAVLEILRSDHLNSEIPDDIANGMNRQYGIALQRRPVEYDEDSKLVTFSSEENGVWAPPITWQSFRRLVRRVINERKNVPAQKK